MLSHMACLQVFCDTRVPVRAHTPITHMHIHIHKQTWVSFSLHHFSFFSFLPCHLFPPLPSHRHSFFLCIKGEQHHNNSRHDSLTLTLHIMELEVLGSLWCESHKRSAEQLARNTMVPKWNKVCSWRRWGAKFPTWEQSWHECLN